MGDGLRSEADVGVDVGLGGADGVGVTAGIGGGGVALLPVLPVVMVSRAVVPLPNATDGETDWPLTVNVTVAPSVPQPVVWLAELILKLKLVVAEDQLVVMPQSVLPTYARTTEPAGAGTPFSLTRPMTVIGDSDGALLTAAPG